MPKLYLLNWYIGLQFNFNLCRVDKRTPSESPCFKGNETPQYKNILLGIVVQHSGTAQHVQHLYMFGAE